MANIYTVDSTASPIAGSVVTTDTTGTFSFYAPDGRYDLTVSVTGTTKIVADIEISDVTETQTGDSTSNFGTINYSTALQHSGTPIAATDLSNGVTGTGAVVLASAPTVASLTGTGTTNLANTVLNSANTGTGSALTVGGTSTTTGGISVFVGALGAQNERLSVVPADGSSAAARVGTLSVRTISGGFLTGNETVSISNGVISVKTTSGTSAATISNDTVGGLLIIPSTGASFQWQFLGSGPLQSPKGAGILFQGGSSGTTQVLASVNASGTITIPAATDTLVGQATTDTLTNKRVTPRASALATSTTFTPTSDTADINTMVMTGTAGTLTIAAPTGTPTDGQKLILRIKATNAQTYSFNATYAFSTSVTAPTTLAAGKTDYIGCMWNATNTKWDVVSVDQGH